MDQRKKIWDDAMLWCGKSGKWKCFEKIERDPYETKLGNRAVMNFVLFRIFYFSFLLIISSILFFIHLSISNFTYLMAYILVFLPISIKNM